MIPDEDLVRLTLIYDRFANHLDPLSDDWKRCKLEYFETLREFHGRFAGKIPFDEFRREIQRVCFQRLRGQDKPSAPPSKA
jgi:hypothetical protein